MSLKHDESRLEMFSNSENAVDELELLPEIIAEIDRNLVVCIETGMSVSCSVVRVPPTC